MSDPYLLPESDIISMTQHKPILSVTTPTKQLATMKPRRSIDRGSGHKSLYNEPAITDTTLSINPRLLDSPIQLDTINEINFNNITIDDYERFHFNNSNKIKHNDDISKKLFACEQNHTDTVHQPPPSIQLRAQSMDQTIQSIQNNINKSNKKQPLTPKPRSRSNSMSALTPRSQSHERTLSHHPSHQSSSTSNLTSPYTSPVPSTPLPSSPIYNIRLVTDLSVPLFTRARTKSITNLTIIDEKVAESTQNNQLQQISEK